MTDISDWPVTVHIMKTPSRDPMTGKEWDGFTERIMVPLNGYQMGNLIDAIAHVPDTGDWWGEFCAIVARAMRVGGLTELRSNTGNIYTREQIERGSIRNQSSRDS